jgi:hypothetical protein
MYAPWAFYMGIWALYNPKLPIWPLIGLPDLAGDPFLFDLAKLLIAHIHINIQHVLMLHAAFLARTSLKS